MMRTDREGVFVIGATMTKRESGRFALTLGSKAALKRQQQAEERRIALQRATMQEAIDLGHQGEKAREYVELYCGRCQIEVPVN